MLEIVNERLEILESLVGFCRDYIKALLQRGPFAIHLHDLVQDHGILVVMPLSRDDTLSAVERVILIERTLRILTVISNYVLLWTRAEDRTLLLPHV